MCTIKFIVGAAGRGLTAAPRGYGHAYRRSRSRAWCFPHLPRRPPETPNTADGRCHLARAPRNKRTAYKNIIHNNNTHLYRILLYARVLAYGAPAVFTAIFIPIAQSAVPFVLGGGGGRGLAAEIRRSAAPGRTPDSRFSRLRNNSHFWTFSRDPPRRRTPLSRVRDYIVTTTTTRSGDVRTACSPKRALRAPACRIFGLRLEPLCSL